MNPDNVSTARRAMVPAAVALALMSVLIPVATVRIPPLLDYCNHLARMWLLSGGVGQPPMSSIYAVDWTGTHSNVAIDVAAWLVGRFMPATVLGSLLVAVALVIPAAGAILLNRQLFGRLHWWQAFLPLLAFGQTLLAGFLNFQLGIGGALLFAAADAALARRGWLIASGARAMFSAALIVAHPFAPLFYLALLGGLQLGPALKPLTTWTGARKAVVAAAGACLAGAVPIVLWRLFEDGGSGNAPDVLVWQTLLERAKTLASPVVSYDLRIDSLFVAVLALGVILALVRRRVHFGLGLAAAGLLVLGMIAPLAAFSAWFVPSRFTTMAAFALLAAVQPELPKVRAGVLAAIGVALATLKAGWITTVWMRAERDIHAVQQAMASVPEGAAILVLQHVASNDAAPPGRYLVTAPAYWNYAALAVPERRAFVPSVFSIPGRQPLRVRPPWDQIAVVEGQPPSVDRLAKAARPGQPQMTDWADRFDFVIVLNADLPNRDGPMPALPNLELTSDQGFARLYRIRHAADRRAIRSDP